MAGLVLPNHVFMYTSEYGRVTFVRHVAGLWWKPVPGHLMWRLTCATPRKMAFCQLCHLYMRSSGNHGINLCVLQRLSSVIYKLRKGPSVPSVDRWLFVGEHVVCQNGRGCRMVSVLGRGLGTFARSMSVRLATRRSETPCLMTVKSHDRVLDVDVHKAVHRRLVTAS
jgi:hypothetical protein